MSSIAIAWILFAVYVAGTFVLAWIGHRRTRSFAAFAIGGRDMGPGMAGLTLGATLASTATFVINPGFVFAYGLPALLALTLPLFAGVFCGLLLLGPGFRRHGGQAMTLPHWVGERYGSEGLRGFYAALSILNVFYIVLIVVGSALVMVATMGVSYPVAVTLVVAIVFSYVFLGGTYAHAFTNTAQGAVMIVVALIIFGYALADLGAPGEALAALSARDADLVGVTHPGSPFYRNLAEVLLCPFAIGFALVAQPHLLIKTLYLKDGRDLARFVAIGGGCFVLFSLVLVAGLAARVRLGDDVAQDAALATWLAEAIPAGVRSFIAVAILAAAMSTLDGLLVAVSAIVGADVVAHPAVARRLGLRTDEERQRMALRAGRVAIVLLGVIAWALAIRPPALVGIFGTVGAYGLFVASLPAVVFGVFGRRPPAASSVVVGASAGLALHLGLYYGGATINTGLTATAGLVLALAATPLAEAVRLALAPRPTAIIGAAPKPVLEAASSGLAPSASARLSGRRP